MRGAVTLSLPFLLYHMPSLLFVFVVSMIAAIVFIVSGPYINVFVRPRRHFALVAALLSSLMFVLVATVAHVPSFHRHVIFYLGIIFPFLFIMFRFYIFSSFSSSSMLLY